MRNLYYNAGSNIEILSRFKRQSRRPRQRHQTETRRKRSPMGILRSRLAKTQKPSLRNLSRPTMSRLKTWPHSKL